MYINLGMQAKIFSPKARIKKDREKKRKSRVDK
jgi:hypothetical protein